MARVIRQLDDEALEKPFNKQQFVRLLRYMKPYKKQVIFSLILMVVAMACSLANPFLMSRAIGVLQTSQGQPAQTESAQVQLQQTQPAPADAQANENPASETAVQVQQPQEADLTTAQPTKEQPAESENASLITTMLWILGGMVVLAIVGAVCTRFRIRWMDSAGRRALATLREDLFHHIQGMSFSFFDTRSAGKLLVRVINDVNSLNDLFTNGIVNVLIDCMTIILLVIIMLAVNWKLTLIGMCILPLLLFILFKVKRVMRLRWQKVRVKNSTMNGYLHESLTGMRVTEAFVREDENADTFRSVNSDIRSSWMKAVNINNLFWPMLDLTGNIGTVLVYIAGVEFIKADPEFLANLLLIIWYLGRFWQPLNTLSNFYNSLLSATASMERIFEIMDTESDIQDKENAEVLPPIKGRVTFENVSFSYDREKTVLKNVSFDIAPGNTIALVGPTGAGKTTIVNLLSRFYDPTEGRVLIDGHDLRDMQLTSMRKQMSVMMQDTFIFSGTIMENIRYGRLDATDEEVIEAAKTVSAHDFIMNMPKGYQTEVNERGSSLSQGQRQLISFARALLNDPKILILDEATSSIDTRTEMLIQKALDALLKNRTSFVIAHRLSTIRNADCIFVVQDGRIAEKGNHEELIKLPGGHYRGLCEAQYRFMAHDDD